MSRPFLSALRNSLVPGIPLAILTVLVVVPLVIVLRISFSTPVVASPPYLPLIDPSAGLAGLAEAAGQFHLDNYRLLAGDALIRRAFGTSLAVAVLCSLVIALIGYALAYGIASMPARWRLPLLMLAVVPFLTSFLIRVYAWTAILRPEGFLVSLLAALGLVDPAAPPVFINSLFAVCIGIIYSYLPFFILPAYAAIAALDVSVLEAASDLGASRLARFWRVTLPMTMPGVLAGLLLVFIPVTGEYVIPDLLGGPETLMIGKQLAVEFFQNRDWPLAAAFAMALLATALLPIMLFLRIETGRGSQR